MRYQTLAAMAATAGLALAVPSLAQEGDVKDPGTMMPEGGVELMADLAPENAAGGGDADGSGVFKAELSLDSGQMCYRYAVDDIDDITGAHIRKGTEGYEGEVVVALELAEDGVVEACTTVDRDFAAELVANAGEYNVTIRDEAHPNGALRGQLLR
jgi:hypothetical protein